MLNQANQLTSLEWERLSRRERLMALERRDQFEIRFPKGAPRIDMDRWDSQSILALMERFELENLRQPATAS